MAPIVAFNVEYNFTEQLFLHMSQLTVIRQTLKCIGKKMSGTATPVTFLLVLRRIFSLCFWPAGIL